MSQLFSLGQAAILPDGSWNINQVTATGLDVGVFGAPEVDGERFQQEMPDMAFGLNASSNEIEDLVAAGVIDPAMVTRSALQNAASIAKNILTTEAIVAELPEKEGAGAGGGMPDMSGMM